MPDKDNITPGNEDMLNRYLDGELSAEEKESLELQLITNTDLQAQLDSLRATHAAIRMYGLKQAVGGIHGQMMKELAPKRINKAGRFVRYTIAAAATVILIVGGYMVYNFIKLSSDKIFASHYQTYELVTPRDGNMSELAIATAYREKQYREVLKLHEEKKDYNSQSYFLCGMAALELNDNTKAIDCFKTVAVDKKEQGVLKDQAEYYLALAYIRNKDYDFALELLKNIQNNPAHLYHQKVSDRLIRQVKLLKWR